MRLTTLALVLVVMTGLTSTASGKDLPENCARHVEFGVLCISAENGVMVITQVSGPERDEREQERPSDHLVAAQHAEPAQV